MTSINELKEQLGYIEIGLNDAKSHTEPSFAIEVNNVNKTDNNISATPAHVCL